MADNLRSINSDRDVEMAAEVVARFNALQQAFTELKSAQTKFAAECEGSKDLEPNSAKIAETVNALSEVLDTNLAVITKALNEKYGQHQQFLAVIGKINAEQAENAAKIKKEAQKSAQL